MTIPTSYYYNVTQRTQTPEDACKPPVFDFEISFRYGGMVYLLASSAPSPLECYEQATAFEWGAVHEVGAVMAEAKPE